MKIKCFISVWIVLLLIFALDFASTLSAQAQTFSVLHSFAGGKMDGANPLGRLVMDTKGNLYGTTSSGGASNKGTVFEISTSGTLTLLHSFETGTTDGALPYAGLLVDNRGNLYGTTEFGGAFNNGTVFMLNTSRIVTLLHSFGTGTMDGANPVEGLLLDNKGNFYGTTYSGGASNAGTVYKLDTHATLTLLHSFAGYPADGASPYVGLLLDNKGNFYGTTYSGGASNNGTVYKLDTDGTLTLLHSFAGGTTDGALPYAGLLMDNKGNLYGTTYNGGASNAGTVFRIDTSGTLTVLHSFAPGTTDGVNPFSGVLMDKKGNLYGTTQFGGASGYGTVYKLDTNGTLTLLHSFNRTDGAYPYAGLLMDTKGNLYGTTYRGGASGHGTVFKLTL